MAEFIQLFSSNIYKIICIICSHIIGPLYLKPSFLIQPEIIKYNCYRYWSEKSVPCLEHFITPLSTRVYIFLSQLMRLEMWCTDIDIDIVYNEKISFSADLILSFPCLLSSVHIILYISSYQSISIHNC